MNEIFVCFSCESFTTLCNLPDIFYAGYYSNQRKMMTDKIIWVDLEVSIGKFWRRIFDLKYNAILCCR